MSAVLLPALVTMICIPLVAAFAPVFEGGVLTNLGRAFDEPRFIRSFSYGLSQAFVSSLLAAAIGIPAAFLLARRKFPGKRVLSALSAIPFCVPPLIIAIGFVLYYGREGMLNKFLMHVFGLSEAPVQFLYSFSGVVMAHGFYNFPIVMRFVADAWATVPKAHGDAARLLGASEIKVFLTITLPSILPALGAAMSLVFLMCFYSFVIVLLFGGPGVGTPEVELYRAARFSFDRPLASAFALMETMVAMAVLALYAYFENKTVGERRVVEHAKAIPFQSAGGVVFAILFGIFITIFFLGPLFAIVAESFVVRAKVPGANYPGLGNYISIFSNSSLWAALMNTIVLGVSSAILASVAGFLFSIGLKRAGSTLVAKVLPLLPLGVSGVVLAYGWSTVLGRSSIFGIVAVQAVAAYPFSLRAIQSSVGIADERFVEAARMLGSTRTGAILRVSLPLATPALLSGFALAFAMSAGDANAIIAAPVSGFETLASMLYRLAGAYRFNEACAVAVLLTLATGFVFFIKDARNALS